MSFPTFSPQGDGNVGPFLGACLEFEEGSFPTFSPQGDGNRSGMARVRTLEPKVFSYLFPARGRKLPLPHYSSTTTESSVFPYLFPARGRKPGLSSTTILYPLSLSLPFPRKGTETSNNSQFSLRSTFKVVFPYLFPARGRKRGR
ncbi:hypothetical protein CKA32_006182 [Geitlerinema sp. FC II]|nr:hypothetical protein CKA32_006182 [Geitlerinema sp. FC II]